MTSCWIPHLLALEVSTATRQAQGASRSSAADLRDEPGKSFLGLSGHVGNRSLADIDAELEEFSMDASMPPGAFFRCQSSADCITIMSGSDLRHGQQTAGPELVDVSAQSYTRDRGDGPFRRADACLQLALWLHHRSARPPRARLDWRDEQSDGRMDCTPDHRGLSLGVSTGIPHPRPRSRFWLNRKTAPPGHGHSRQTYCAPLAMAERICRTTDRVHSPRMSGSHHHLGSRASTPGAARLR